MKTQTLSKYNLLKYSMGVAILTIATLAFVNYKNHLNNKKILSETQTEREEIFQAELEYKKIIVLRKNFIAKLIDKNNSQKRELETQLEILEKIQFEVQDDFDRFDAVNAQIGQFMGSQADLFLAGKKSIFKTENDLHQMERIDRTIDEKRKEVSARTFRLAQKVKLIKKDFFATEKKIIVPHFKVDHLILSQKSAS